jgi:hypothetical protein
MIDIESLSSCLCVSSDTIINDEIDQLNHSMGEIYFEFCQSMRLVETL